ncbi:MAG TPA: hypothetical protein PKC15_07790 [Rhodocyclaceae bacterium]|nr:hypothetical protein [Rhodocyclaceae bacterium]
MLVEKSLAELQPCRMAKALEQWQVEDAQRLKALFGSRVPKMSQMEFGAAFEIGNQGAVWQYLNGRIALNKEAAAKFAKGLGVSVSEFSPRLAAEIGAQAQVAGCSSEGGRAQAAEGAADRSDRDDAAALDRARLELVRAAADAPKEAIDRARVALGLPPMDVPAHSGPIAPMDRRVSPGSIKPIGSDRPETGRD